MKREYNLVEFFSGIGSQAKALKNLGIQIHTLGTCEWDIHAIVAYDLIHTSGIIPDEIQALEKPALLELLKNYTFSNSGKTAVDYSALRTYSVEVLRRIYASIMRNKNHVDISQLHGIDMPDGIDILTYSFPCQDLSNVGALHGYNKGIDKNSGSRSSLLWQVGRILTEMHNCKKTLPRFLLMENVPTLLSDRHISNYKTWISDLAALGYVSRYFQLNASSFGLPQNRPRLLMISIFVGSDEKCKALVEKYLSSTSETSIVSEYRKSKHYHKYTISDLLRINYDNPKIFSEAIECTPNDTESRRKIWDENPQLVLKGNIVNNAFSEIRTITTKQDRNPNSGNLYFESGIEGRGNFRYLTPRECMLFMGFTDADFKKLKDNNVEFHKGDALFARDKIIRMAGNSIPVKLLEGVFYQILLIDDLLEEYKRFVDHKNVVSSDKDASSIIRSYLFSRGIRSRPTNELYPANASIVYPKYRTAIYFSKCFLEYKNGAECTLAHKHMLLMKNDEPLDVTQATSIGWNAIVISHCDLRKDALSETLSWIEKCIRQGSRSFSLKEGMVYIHGGCS